MSKNKIQHYVPRFYLKRFSYNKQIKNPNILGYDIRKNTYFDKKIEKECQEFYFYSKEKKEEIEKVFSSIEYETKKPLDKIEKDTALDAEDLKKLYIFIAFQQSRTKRSKIKYEKIVEYCVDMEKELAINKAKEKGINLKKEDWDYQFYTHLEVITGALERFPMLSDLKYNFIVNNTSIDLITNDCAVVFYNFLYSGLKNVGKIGLATKGLNCLFTNNLKKKVFYFQTARVMI